MDAKFKKALDELSTLRAEFITAQSNYTAMTELFVADPTDEKKETLKKIFPAYIDRAQKYFLASKKLGNHIY